MTRDEMIFSEAQRLAGNSGMSVRDIANARETVDTLLTELAKSQPAPADHPIHHTEWCQRHIEPAMIDAISGKCRRCDRRVVPPASPPADAVTMTVRQLGWLLHAAPFGESLTAAVDRDGEPRTDLMSQALAIRDHLASRAKGGR